MDYNARMHRMVLLFSLMFAFLPAAYAEQTLTKLDTVVIDPGHGGASTGARAEELTEKDFCQKLAQAIKEAVEKENGQAIKVVVTAPPEKDPDQRDRAFAANGAGGKVFISLHAASGFAPTPRMLGIYVQDAPQGAEGTWREAGKKYSVKSFQLAEKLKEALDGFYPSNRFFIGRAPLTDFNGVAMPAVAVEVVQLNSQLQPLAPDMFQRLASAIYSGLVEFDRRQ